MMIRPVPRLFPSQLRPQKLAADFPAADEEPLGHFGHQPCADHGRFAELGSGWNFGLRLGPEFNQLSRRRR